MVLSRVVMSLVSLAAARMLQMVEVAYRGPRNRVLAAVGALALVDITCALIFDWRPLPLGTWILALIIASCSYRAGWDARG
jgi:hypothetical protein